LRIGITGGIGSGKSTVAHFFGVLGIPLYNADARARAIMETDPVLRAAILALFGPDSFVPQGTLNRAHIASQAFASPDLTKQLNAAVHPAVEADYELWASQPRPGVPYTLKEAALLLEAGSYKRLHFLLHVSAPEPVRIARTLARDPHRTHQQVADIISRQLPETQRQARCHFILQNSGQESIIAQALELHALFLTQADLQKGVL